MSKLTNQQFLTAVSKAAPEFKELASKTASEVFTEAGFQSLQNLPGTDDAVTRFYNVALLVGWQTVEHARFKDVLASIGILERLRMSMGAYKQENRVRRIKNVNPAWLGTDGTGLKNGDSVDPYKVRKPEIDQNYYGLNWNYQNFISLQDFDLKLGWITPDNGIQSIVSAVYEMVDLDRLDTEFSKFFTVLSGAINSTAHPLLDTQQITLASWTDAAPTDAEIKSLIEVLKNIVEVFDSQPSVDIYNAGAYPNGADASDMVMLVRNGFKSKIDTLMAYTFGPEYLQFPIKVKSVPNFGGMQYFFGDTDDYPLYPHYDDLGAVDGWAISEGGAKEKELDDPGVRQFDPNANVIAVIAQKGVIFELIQNEMKVRTIFNPRGEYQNTFFNEMNNGINYNHYKNLITISKPAGGTKTGKTSGKN